MAPTTRARGHHFEQLAEQLLRKAGLKTLERNFSCRSGEIDLVMIDHHDLVFVEVRYRQNSEYGSALETITPAKQLRLIRTANFYLQKHPEFANRACRFDAVGMTGAAEQPDMRWIKGAFSA